MTAVIVKKTENDNLCVQNIVASQKRTDLVCNPVIQIQMIIGSKKKENVLQVFIRE